MKPFLIALGASVFAFPSAALAQHAGHSSPPAPAQDAHAGHEMPPPPAPEPADPHAGHDKIGRASCRERVCQYVSISVVAVSLNKKKSQITQQLKHNSRQNNT